MPLEGEKPMAGYRGFVPTCETTVMPLKTNVSSRMALTERTLPVQAALPPISKTPDPIRSYFLPKRHVGHTTYSAATSQYVRTASDVPERAHERTLPATSEPPKFTSLTDKQEASAAIVEGRVPNFFSVARQIERKDDDDRRNVTVAPTRSGAAHNLRTVDIVRKREQDAGLAPPKEAYKMPARVRPNGLPPPSASDSVKFTHAPPLPSSQLEYTHPRSRLTHFSPTKSSGSSASGADESPHRAVTAAASTADMFIGTAKAREDLVPGFMGHVPCYPGNSAKVKGPGIEILREYSKCPVRVSAGPQVDRLASLHMRGSDTVQGESNMYVVQDTVEKAMNTHDGTGRKNAVRTFFSAGLSEQDSLIADQFCSRYRPLEGVMKMGPPDGRSWISMKELHAKIHI